MIVFAAIDNLWKGTSSQAIQNLNLMFGRPETEGLRLMSALRARSAHAGSRCRSTRGCSTDRRRLPAGFRAAGVAAGIKPSGGTDVGLLVCDAPQRHERRALHALGHAAAPVLLTRERCRLDAIRAVAVNSGNANAATGSMGLQEAAKMQGAAAMAAGVAEDQVAVCSTGVIGVPLDGRAVVKGLAAARAELRPDGDGDLQRGDHDDRPVREAGGARGRPARAARCA